MPDHLTPGPEPTDPLAAALARLRPAPAAAEKPAFLFRAGQASRDAVARRWQVVAAVAAVALVGSWVYGAIRFSELQRRAATAEAKLQEVAAAPVSPVTPPAPAVPRAFPVPDAPSMPVPPSYESDPTPEELADALRQRNEILTAGLTLLPKAVPPTGNDRREPLPGGVFATPRLEPTKPHPDDDD